jgi:large subunit ribosomal protein L31
MKKDIHPEYHKNATIKCACGNSFKFGSTKKEVEVEICANCHPFFSGKEKLIDTAGRVDKFKQRMAKAQILKSTKTAKKPRANKQKTKK